MRDRPSRRTGIAENHSDLVAFLRSPAGRGGTPVQRIDTDTSIVFQAGDRAWKMKRAVRYGYLDYSTADRRRAMCEAEVRINRRTAPNLYRGVVALTRQADPPRIDAMRNVRLPASAA